MKSSRQKELLCWVCRKLPANTGEHVPKKSDLKKQFLSLSKDNPIYEINQNRSIPIKGLNNPRFKVKNALCHDCNNILSKPYDNAWDELHSFIEKNWNILKIKKRISTKDVFKSEFKKKSIYVHLYFLKIFGCLAFASKSTMNNLAIRRSLNLQIPLDTFFVLLRRFPSSKFHHEHAFKPQLYENKTGAVALYSIGNIYMEMTYVKNKITIGKLSKDYWNPKLNSRQIPFKNLVRSGK